MLAFLLAGVIAAQDGPPVITIGRTPACGACRVVLRRKAVLGEESGPGEIASLPSSVGRDGRGRYWVATGHGEPLVFGPDGRFLARVGREGQGPGEFQAPTEVVTLPGDSVLVVDALNRRGTVVGPDLAPHRAVRLPMEFRPAVAVHWPDTVIANGSGLHHVTFAGEEAAVVRTYARAGKLPWESFQFIAQGARPGLWSLQLLQYRATRWTPAGATVSLESAPEWFPPSNRYWNGNPATPPPPRMAGGLVDSSGRLWVFVSVPAPDWRSAWELVPAGAREVPGRMILVERLFRTRVDVIDPAAGRLIAHGQLDAWVIGVLGNGDVVLYEVDASEQPKLVIATPELVR